MSFLFFGPFSTRLELKVGMRDFSLAADVEELEPEPGEHQHQHHDGEGKRKPGSKVDHVPILREESVTEGARQRAQFHR